MSSNPGLVEATAFVDQNEGRDTEMWYGKVTEPAYLIMCHMVRYEVFIKGQGIDWFDEVDGRDDQYQHFLGTADADPIATARIQQTGDAIALQRVAVLESARETGAGRAIMETIIAYAREQPDVKQVLLGAQVQVIGFYEKLGFSVFGETYVDAGIEHKNMVLKL